MHCPKIISHCFMVNYTNIFMALDFGHQKFAVDIVMTFPCRLGLYHPQTSSDISIGSYILGSTPITVVYTIAFKLCILKVLNKKCKIIYLFSSGMVRYQKKPACPVCDTPQRRAAGNMYCIAESHVTFT